MQKAQAPFLQTLALVSPLPSIQCGRRAPVAAEYPLSPAPDLSFLTSPEDLLEKVQQGHEHVEPPVPLTLPGCTFRPMPPTAW